MRGRSTWTIAASILLLGACGPTEAEVGGIALQALPLSLFFGLAIQRGYMALWRRVGSTVSLDVRPTLALAGLSIVLVVVTMPRTDVFLDEIGVALAFVGTSYLAYLAVIMRIAVAVNRRNAYSAAPVIAWLLLAVPALWLAVFGSTGREASDELLAIFILPGYGGLVAGGLVALLFIEVGLRIHLVRKRERESEPVFPEARIARERDD